MSEDTTQDGGGVPPPSGEEGATSAGTGGNPGDPAAADPIYDMCMNPGTLGPELCDCVVSGLDRTLTAGDRALYASVAAGYLDALGRGLGRADAWDAAVQAEAGRRGTSYPALLGATNAIGRTHREIQKGCGG